MMREMPFPVHRHDVGLQVTVLRSLMEKGRHQEAAEGKRKEGVMDRADGGAKVRGPAAAMLSFSSHYFPDVGRLYISIISFNSCVG